MNEVWVQRIGWFASMMALLMFASYLDQIRLNLDGQKGSVLLPVATLINCMAWSSYAMLKQQKDWPIFVCNAFGILVALLTLVTAVI
jgi:uncharacterized protein with PQ loop repeat